MGPPIACTSDYVGAVCWMRLLDVDVPAPLELIRRAALPRRAVVSFPISPTLLIPASNILGRQPPYDPVCTWYVLVTHSTISGSGPLSTEVSGSGGGPHWHWQWFGLAHTV